MTLLDFVLIALAALAGGAVNAIAGGGTLITFPMLTAVGLPAVAANITNTVALAPGYLGGTLAQAKDLQGQGQRLRWLAPVASLGGIVGGLLLVQTEERMFRTLIPYLILLACLLLAFQGRLRKWLARRLAAGQPATASQPALNEYWVTLPVFLAAIYGGYFGAGLSVIVLAVLGLVLSDSLTRLNALKQAIAFSVNVAAALFFLFSGQVVWPAAAVMAIAALIGGAIGGRLASRVPPELLRVAVVTIGVIVALIYLLR